MQDDIPTLPNTLRSCLRRHFMSHTRLLNLDAAPLMGVATDDSHQYHGKPGAHVGRAWVQVRSRLFGGRIEDDFTIHNRRYHSRIRQMVIVDRKNVVRKYDQVR